MKLNYTTKNGRLAVEIEGESQTDVWDKLANFQEIFEESTCGKCGSENVRFVVRTVDDNNYHELRCMERGCRARLSFGQNKKGGGLFPKRKDENGGWKPDNGWTVYNKESKQEE